MRHLAVFAATALLATPAFAQSIAEDTTSEDSIRPKNFTVPGASQQVAAGLAAGMRLERKVQDYCWQYGCLVIVNETANYNVTAFHVETSGRDGARRWGPNQFGEQLRPMKATFRFKTADASACDVPVMFLLRDRKTKEVATIETRASLCKAPRLDSLLRIRMVRPEVRVE